MKNILLAVIVVAFSLLGQVVEHLGSIRGRVIDPQGNPVANVRILASLETGRVPVTAVATSDATGGFFVEGATVGLNTIYASKEAEGYPNSFFAFYETGEPLPVVNVEDGKTADSIVVRLPAKMGKVAWSIRDSKTGNPIPDALVRLVRSSDPMKYVVARADKTGQLEQVVPPVAFDAVISAEGYVTWNSNQGGHSLTIPGETRKELTVQLTASR